MTEPALGEWACLSTEAGTDPAALDPAGGWLPVTVPGTAAGALDAAGLDWHTADLDGRDWWFRCFVSDALDATAGPWALRLDGLATISDVWLDGAQLLHSTSMFREHLIELDTVAPGAQLLIRCGALTPVLAQRRPRPRARWKVARLSSQNLRWMRTTLLGRLTGWVPTPPPVGPWRPITLTPARLLGRADVAMHAVLDDDGRGGSVHVSFPAAGRHASGQLQVGDVVAPLRLDADRLSGSVHLARVERWWPHTHGDQPTYPVRLMLTDQSVDLGAVAFRSLRIDQEGAGFTVVVNGVRVLCRGAVWTPLDPVGLSDDPVALRAALEQVREGNLNMLRVPGETVYPSATMVDLLDELGILLWQDCMFAFADIPDSPELLGDIDAELRAVFAMLAPHACLALLSGGSEIEQQAAMVGTPLEQRAMPLFEQRIPALVDELLSGTAYIPASPTGGALPIHVRTGVAHYYGVGAYLRAPDDARRSGVRFAAECLAFATPPEPQTVENDCGGAARAGHHPDWKAAVYRDAGAAWDFEDVRDHYVRTLFGIEPATVRYSDPGLALDLGRAVVAELFQRTWSEWQRPGSSCAGGLVFHLRDSAPGAGLGIVDALGRPKAPWYVMRRVLAPLSVVITDEALNGLDAHLVNDTATAWTGRLTLDVFANGQQRVESVALAVQLPPHSRQSVELDALPDGFRDLAWSHRFGPPTNDVVAVSLTDESGALISRAVHLIGDAPRPRETGLGLSATAQRIDDSTWTVRVDTERLAQWVSLDIPGWVPLDGWFHLPPGGSATVVVRAEPSGSRTELRGTVRALNAVHDVRIATD